MIRLLMLLPLAAVLACEDRTSSQDTTAIGEGTDTPAAAAGPTTGVGEGATSAMLDPNSASREQLAAAGVDSATIGALMRGRPFADMLAVDAALATTLNAEQRRGLYAKVWKRIDLNSAKGEEILLIPGVGNRMRREFEEYRPYTSMEQFRREIGKYVDKNELARLEQYVMIAQ
jgi:hypothetical protein